MPWMCVPARNSCPRRTQTAAPRRRNGTSSTLRHEFLAGLYTNTVSVTVLSFQPPTAYNRPSKLVSPWAQDRCSWSPPRKAAMSPPQGFHFYSFPHHLRARLRQVGQPSPCLLPGIVALNRAQVLLPRVMATRDVQHAVKRSHTGATPCHAHRQDAGPLTSCRIESLHRPTAGRGA
eukprot:scaffold1146_cov399-Prasinococcus_capsulatus_cf.AAC.86